MIWILYFLNNRASSSTGWVDLVLGYLCPRCGARTQAMSRVLGSSTGASPYEAYARAQQVAWGKAQQGIYFAACPQCGQNHPDAVAAMEKQHRAGERNRKWRLPVALALAVVVFVVGIVPAVRDLKYSSGLAILVLSLIVFVGALALALFSVPKKPLLPENALVWFWWNAAGHAPAWLPAPAPSNLPPPPKKEGWLFGTSLALAGLGALASFGALIVLEKSSHDLWVVVPNMAPVGTVRVDGKDMPFKVERPMGEAVAYGKITIRGDGPARRVEWIDPATGTRTIPLPTSKHGWVLSPRGRERDLCFAETHTVYGAGKSPQATTLLDNHTDLVVASRRYDHWFEEAPKTLYVDNGQSKERWAFRAVSCSVHAASREFELFTGHPVEDDESDGTTDL